MAALPPFLKLAREALDDAAQALASRLQVDYLEYRNLEAQHHQWPSKDLYVTFRKEIAPEVEENMRAIPRKQRAMVRKGIKAGLESVVDEDTSTFFLGIFGKRAPAWHPGFFQKLFSPSQRSISPRIANS